MTVFDAISEAYAEAVLAKDENAFLQLYTDDVVVFDIWDEWIYEGRDAWGGMAARWFASLGDERVRVTISPISGQIAELSALYLATVRYAHVDQAGRELKSLENRLTWALRRTDGNWRISHEHTSTPISSETFSLVKRAADAARRCTE